jgi:hypothetical protein
MAKYAVALFGVFLVAANTDLVDKGRVWLRVLESRILLQHPELHSEIFAFVTDAEQRLQGYRRLMTDHAVPEIQEIIELLYLEISNRKFEEYFLSALKPEYITLLNQSGKLDQPALCQRMLLIAQRLSELLKQYSIAAVYNQLGNIELPCGRTNETLSNLYTGLSLYPTDPYLRESLGYALWILNEDSHGALSVASQLVNTLESEPRAGTQTSLKRFGISMRSGGERSRRLRSLIAWWRR